MEPIPQSIGWLCVGLCALAAVLALVSHMTKTARPQLSLILLRTSQALSACVLLLLGLMAIPQKVLLVIATVLFAVSIICACLSMHHARKATKIAREAAQYLDAERENRRKS